MAQLALASEFLLPAGPTSRRQLERLDLADSSPDTDGVDAAMSRLTAGGLVANMDCRSPIRISGGRSVREEGGFEFFVDAFVIVEEEPDTILVTIEGPKTLGAKTRTTTLGEAIDVVLETFRRRR